MNRSNLITGLILLAASGCSFDHMKDQNGSIKGSNALLDRPVPYSEVFTTVIAPRCVSCHGSGNPDRMNLETYESTFAGAAQIEKYALIDKTMPKGQALSGAEIQVLATWLAQGATRNGAMRGSSKLRERIVWSTIRDEIFEKKCLDCHSLPRPEKDLDLTSLSQVKASINKIFDRAVIVQDMPLEPFEHLTIDEKQALAQWIALGMPE